MLTFSSCSIAFGAVAPFEFSDGLCTIPSLVWLISYHTIKIHYQLLQDRKQWDCLIQVLNSNFVRESIAMPACASVYFRNGRMRLMLTLVVEWKEMFVSRYAYATVEQAMLPAIHLTAVIRGER